MAAQFGIKAPEYMGNHAHYIGGWSNVININEVLNTNLSADKSQAVIAGKGPDTYTNYVVNRRGKRKDYFTSALPWTQKINDGTVVNIG